MALSQWIPVSRRGGGEYDTQNVTVPAGVDTVHIRLDVAPADFATPDLRVTATIEASVDGGATWAFQMSVSWFGSSPPPTLRSTVGWYAAVNGISKYQGQSIRVHFSTIGTFRWGLEGELIA